MVPTTAFTFPGLSWGPAAWHKVSAAPACGSGDSQGGWWQRQHGGQGAGSAWPPAPDSCQTSAAGVSWLPPGSAAKTTEQDGSCEGQPALLSCFLGWGTPVLQRGAAQSWWSPWPPWPSHAASSMTWQSRLGTLGDVPGMPWKVSGREGVHCLCLINSFPFPNLHQG